MDAGVVGDGGARGGHFGKGAAGMGGGHFGGFVFVICLASRCFVELRLFVMVGYVCFADVCDRRYISENSRIQSSQ